MNIKKHTKPVPLFFLLVLLVVVCFFIFTDAYENPLRTIVFITLGTSLLSFFFGLLTKDYSWTDRLWSTLPIVYGWLYAYSSDFSLVPSIGATLVTIWALRLTFNFARRGGYTHTEDYRWSILQTKISHPVIWQLFNALFICLYQQFLFICFTVPLFSLYVNPTPITSPVVLGAILCVFFLVVETIADEQQYRFQESKKGMIPPILSLKDDYKRGFRTTGLFSRSRHPNYMGELGFWWSLYYLSSASLSTGFHWTILGPILLTILFIGSTRFTESITEKKYEEYKEYKRNTWAIFPRPW